LSWPSRILLAVLLLIGAWEAGRLWLGCVTSVATLDSLYVCTVVAFDIHHFDALLLLLGAAWLLITGVVRGKR
jgi:hypothetical protein